MIILDCTLRDGGYYNAWDFAPSLIEPYLVAMAAAGVNFVECGLRCPRVDGKHLGYKGPCAFTSDEFLEGLARPAGLALGVMVNAADLLSGPNGLHAVLAELFPRPADRSPVVLVRIACHVHEFKAALPASEWLKQRGYTVGFNVMQVSDRSASEIVTLAQLANQWPIDVIYFADSMGSMDPDETAAMVGQFRLGWAGALGVHTHDNMGMALQNALRAVREGVTWVDATVTGMGRGPGNARMEYLALEAAQMRGTATNLVPLLKLIEDHFAPMQRRYGWGTNPYYYLAGKYGIHPTYVQEMLGDRRYSAEDILSVIEFLRGTGGRQKYSADRLESARGFYSGEPRGSWVPETALSGRELVLLGTGGGVSAHRVAIESFIRKRQPYVIALNAQEQVAAELIDARIASHPLRLLADCEVHTRLPQPLITPASMLPDNVRVALGTKPLRDFGISIRPGAFSFGETFCTLPTALVAAYALAVAASGKASRVYLAGFDGYPGEDPRNAEMDQLFAAYADSIGAVEVVSITPTRYSVPATSVYALGG